MGAFLHATLRPVLKLQNDLLLAVVADFVRDHHITLRPTDQHHQLAELLARNTKLRYTVVGLITGAVHHCRICLLPPAPRRAKPPPAGAGPAPRAGPSGAMLASVMAHLRPSDASRCPRYALQAT